MIPNLRTALAKSGDRFSEKVMLRQEGMNRFSLEMMLGQEIRQ
ncbi:hypothetical protein C8D77_1075 [Mesorhizobium loti]|jgi:hypothetical protein|uniref:Uncharacterized protein n=1 Tax=Rhizobium loti TaxID=381 RepID=A0A8E2W9G7_RHILI|nr:hypothetical protein [Mesorhizobium sp. M7D.F.Ca.US.004.03.1.1]PWJ89363.1 hypothetical protein C8D77_1075 [Mesorhizobium loti]